eukprot:COSAG01_NODE_480_length_16473_cov_655.154208_17_plen_145_part_00
MQHVCTAAADATEATKAELLCLLGELMRGSHLSYSRCGLGSDSTDLIVKLAAQAGPAKGCYGGPLPPPPPPPSLFRTAGSPAPLTCKVGHAGAKITGGGSGGTVVVVTKAGGEAVIQELAERYANTGPYLLSRLTLCSHNILHA